MQVCFLQELDWNAVRTRVPGGLYECHLQKASEEFENAAGRESESESEDQARKPMGWKGKTGTAG